MTLTDVPRDVQANSRAHPNRTTPTPAIGAKASVASDTGPFSIVPEWLLDSGASSSAIHLYALLSRYADATGFAFPSRRTLAGRMQCSTRSIDRYIVELVAREALVVEARRTTSGDPDTNSYTVIRKAPATYTLAWGSDSPAERGSETDAGRGGD